MDLIKEIQDSLRSKGIKQADFCKKVKVGYKDFIRRFSAFERKIEKINDQLKEAGLKLHLKRIEDE